MDTLKDKHNLETLAASGRPPWEVWTAPDGDPDHRNGLGRDQARAQRDPVTLPDPRDRVPRGRHRDRLRRHHPSMLIAIHPSVEVCWVVLSAHGERADEVHASAEAFLQGSERQQIIVAGLPRRLPSVQRRGRQAVLRGPEARHHAGSDLHALRQGSAPGSPTRIGAHLEHVSRPFHPRVRGSQVRRRPGRPRTSSSTSTRRSSSGRSRTCSRTSRPSGIDGGSPRISS